MVWGPDLKEEHPTLYLRVRHAAQERGATLIVIHPRRSGLDDRANHRISYRPGAGADVLTGLKGDRYPEIAAALAEGPIVALVGRTGYTEDPRLAEAVAAWVRTLPGAKLLPLARRSNTYGALDMGLAPSLLPGRVAIGLFRLGGAWGEIPSTRGRDARGILDGLVAGEIIGLVLAGADPVRDVPDGALARSAIEKARFVVAIDLFLTDSSRLADVVLPAEGFSEKEGTVTNVEGRVQKVARVVPGPGQSRPDWSILDDLASRMGRPIGLDSPEAISKEISTVAAAYEGVTWEVVEAVEGRCCGATGGRRPAAVVLAGGHARARPSPVSSSFTMPGPCSTTGCSSGTGGRWPSWPRVRPPISTRTMPGASGSRTKRWSTSRPAPARLGSRSASTRA